MLLNCLGFPESDLRLRQISNAAIRVILDHPCGIPVLASALRDDAQLLGDSVRIERVRVDAADLLGEFAEAGHLSEIGIDALCFAALHGSARLRASAVGAIAGMGHLRTRAISAFAACVADDDLMRRYRSIEILKSLGVAAREAAPALLRALNDPSLNTRDAAAQALVEIGIYESDLGLSEEDRRLIGWFKTVAIADHLQLLQVFWCVGVLEGDALLQCGDAMGYGKENIVLQHIKSKGAMSDLPVGESYLKAMYEQLATMFNVAPFSNEAWDPTESCPDFRVERMRGKRVESQWTPRARRAWQYIDRFLEMSRLKPRFIHFTESAQWVDDAMKAGKRRRPKY